MLYSHRVRVCTAYRLTHIFKSLSCFFWYVSIYGADLQFRFAQEEREKIGRKLDRYLYDHPAGDKEVGGGEGQ